MTFENMTKDQLAELCKANGIKGYSKLKKNEVIKMLRDKNIQEVEVEAKPKEKKPSKKEATPVDKKSKPRVEKLDKKLLKNLKPENYKDAIQDRKEDPDTKYVMNLVCDDLQKCIDECDVKDHQQFVDKYGSLTALLEYVKLHPKFDIREVSEKEVYKMLVLHLFLANEKIAEALVKTFAKYHAKLHKEPVKKESAKKPKADKVTKVKEVKKPKEDETEDEVEGDYCDDDAEVDDAEVDDAEVDDAEVEESEDDM
jgi:hypothetical protein